MVRAVIGHQVTAIRRPRLGQPAHSLLGLLSLGPRSKQGPKTGSTAPSPPSPWARNRGPVLKGPRDLRPARAELRPRPRRAGTRLGHRPFARGVEAGLWAERGAKGAAASRLCRAGPGVRPGVSLPSGSRLGRLRSRHVMYPRSRGENCYFSLPSPRKATTVGTLGQLRLYVEDKALICIGREVAYTSEINHRFSLCPLGTKRMLPRAGIYYFPWEISSGVVPEGETVRTFGRFHCYDMVRSRVTLVAQHESVQHQVYICTKLVEPFQAQPGSLYIVLGEYERSNDKVSMVKARVLTCVEGINLPLLEQAIQNQRKYHQEREHRQEEGSPERGQESKDNSQS